MDTQQFWSMIETARQESAGNLEKQHDLLIEALTQLPDTDIQSFNYILCTMEARSYRADLWDAFCLLYPLYSDSAFWEFRNWLIAQGQVVFEEVLENPDNLADIVTKEQRTELHDHRMISIAYDAYKQKTDQDLPKSAYPAERLTLVGGPLTPEDELPAKFPRIMAKLGTISDEELFGETDEGD